jgi:hypothetical protein
MNVDICQRWTAGMVTTRGVVAQMLTSDVGPIGDLFNGHPPMHSN